MKLVFLGTSAFAVPALQSLNSEDDFTVSAVVSRPDRPAGRGRKLRKPPVAVEAEALGLRVLQPEKLREIREELRDISPQVMVSASYGGWLPEWLLTAAPMGVVNIHPSLLPKHRGAAPVIRAVLNGDSHTGVSFMVTDSGWDTGDLLKVFRRPLPGDLSAGELEIQLAELAASELPGVLRAYSSGAVKPVPQTGEESYAEKVTSDESIIYWDEPAELVKRKILAFNPVPGARTRSGDQVLKIYTAETAYVCGRPGEIVSLSPLTVACGTGSVALLQVQPQGKKKMSSQEYVRGYRLKPGEFFGEK